MTAPDHPGYRDFFDERFRLGRVDRDQRELLHRGLAAAPTIPPTKPSSAGPPVSRQAAERAAAAGLVGSGADAVWHIECGPETLHWAICRERRRRSLSSAPAARSRSG